MYKVTALSCSPSMREADLNCDMTLRSRWSLYFRAAFAGYLPAWDLSATFPRSYIVERHLRGPWGDLAPYLESNKDEIRCITADASVSKLEESGIDVVFADYICPHCAHEGSLSSEGFRVSIAEGDFDTYWEKEDPSSSRSSSVSVATAPSRVESRRWTALDDCPYASRPFGARDVFAELQVRMQQPALPIGPISGCSYATITVGRPGAFRGIYECPVCGCLFFASFAAQPTAIISTREKLLTVATTPSSVGARLDVENEKIFLELFSHTQPSSRIRFHYNVQSGNWGYIDTVQNRGQLDLAFEAIQRFVCTACSKPISSFSTDKGIVLIQQADLLLEEAFDCWSRTVSGLPF